MTRVKRSPRPTLASKKLTPMLAKSKAQKNSSLIVNELKSFQGKVPRAIFTEVNNLLHKHLGVNLPSASLCERMSSIVLPAHPELWAFFVGNFSRNHKVWMTYEPLVNFFKQKFSSKSCDFLDRIDMIEKGSVPKGDLVVFANSLVCKTNKIVPSQELWTDFPDLWAEFQKSGLPVTKFKQDRERIAVKKVQRLSSATQPSHFSTDVLDLIGAYTPLPSLGRLRRTCVFARFHISDQSLQKAKQRALLTFGRFDIVALPRLEFSIRNTDEETITISLLSQDTNTLRVKKDGKMLIAEPLFQCIRMLDVFNSIGSINDSEREKFKFWFRTKTEDGTIMLWLCLKNELGTAEYGRYVCHSFE